MLLVVGLFHHGGFSRVYLVSYLMVMFSILFIWILSVNFLDISTGLC